MNEAIQSFRNEIISAQPEILSVIWQIIIIFLIFFIGRIVIGKVTGVIDRAMGRSGRIEPGVRHFLVSLIRMIFYFILILIIARRLGISNTSLAAVVASGGLALGLALQGSLQNFAGGILILTMKPFSVGDYISCASGEGTVKAIGLVYTTLCTMDNRSVTVPNGTLSNGVITNMSGYDIRRFEISFGVSYNADTEEVRKIVTETIRENKDVLPDKPVTVALKSFGDSSVLLSAFGWSGKKSYEEFLTLQSNLREAVKKRLDAEKISIPFPQMDVHIRQ